MKRIAATMMVSLLAASTVSAQQAAPPPLPEFSAAEIRAHRERIDVITGAAATCLSRTYDEHVRFHKRYGVSKFFGDRRPDYRTRRGREEALRASGYDEARIAEIAGQQQGISCIGLTRACLREGFAAAGMTPTWNKIDDYLKIDNKVYGTDLQRLLRKLGWKILYWNPDPSSNERWDREDQALNPLQPGRSWNAVWGGHALRYRSAVEKGNYYNIPVDDTELMVGFGDEQPAEFRRFPFFVGTAHAGYHVFPGTNGLIIEAHSMRDLRAKDNLEISPFNPLAPGGGPRWTRSERYRSGVVAVPPSRR